MGTIAEQLAELHQNQLLRTLRTRESRPGRSITISGREYINFSSNDYLGLAGHQALASAAANAALSDGTGSTASRLVVGNTDLHLSLERELAGWHQAPGVLLFNSGYQANLGLISTLAGHGDTIVSDALNHASIIDGCRISRANVRVAKHANVDHFDQLLREAPSTGRKLVVTDSVFSMDGDFAPLQELRGRCDAHGAMLLVDEAHALGVVGKGMGLCYESGIQADAIVGGLGKAFGSFGGYVSASSEIIALMINRARSFVYSTALPPAVVAASRAALQIMENEEGKRLRQQLQQRISQFGRGLTHSHSMGTGAKSAIYPLVVGCPEAALNLSDTLMEQGLFCQAIRPPTVPRGTSRLRICLSALHTEEDVELLLECIHQNVPRETLSRAAPAPS